METNCPYRGLPDRAVWRQSVGRRSIETILPIDDATAPIAANARIAIAEAPLIGRRQERRPWLGDQMVEAELG